MALTLLNNALKITVTNVDCLSEREIDIMQSIAILYAEIKEYEKSINILKMFKNFDNLDFPRDKEIKLKVVFNLTKCLNLMDQYEESIKYSDKGMKIAINLNTLYLLGELYYFKASNLLKLKQPNEEAVINNMKKHYLYLN